MVTGAAGFIGSHLTDALLAAGHTVVGIDAFTSSYAEAQKRANLGSALRSAGFELVEKDIAGEGVAEHLAECDVVFHLAGQPGVRESWGSEFEEYARRNILASQRLLEAARASQVGRVVFASSSSVYGSARAERFSESLRPEPVSPYGVSKLAAEELCFAYQRSFGVPVIVLRYFTSYGPRQRPDMAFSRFIDAIRHQRTLTIYGDGSQERDFTYIEDIVAATIAAAGAAPDGQAINVGSGAAVPLIAAIHVIEEAVGRGARLAFEPARPGDMPRTCADLGRAQQLLGYAPETTLAGGLRRQVTASFAEGSGRPGS